MKTQKKIPVNFRFAQETIEALEKLAEKQGVDKTHCVEALIRRAAKRRKCW